MNWFVAFIWTGEKKKRVCLSLLSEHAQTVLGLADLVEICIPLLNVDDVKQYIYYILDIMQYRISFRIFQLSLLKMKPTGKLRKCKVEEAKKVPYIAVLCNF